MTLEGTQFTYTGFITICGLLGGFLGYFFLPYDLNLINFDATRGSSCRYKYMKQQLVSALFQYLRMLRRSYP